MALRVMHLFAAAVLLFPFERLSAEKTEFIEIGAEDELEKKSVSAPGLQEARALTTNGATRYFVGMGLEYAALPLSFISVETQSEAMGLAFLYLGTGLTAQGLQISGAIRSGIGASLAYDYGTERGTVTSRNTNWGYYRGAWALQAAATITNLIGVLSVSSGQASTGSVVTLSLVNLGLNIAADALLITSVGNSLKYTREAQYVDNTSRLEFNLAPVVSCDGKAGLQLAVRF